MFPFIETTVIPRSPAVLAIKEILSKNKHFLSQRTSNLVSGLSGKWDVKVKGAKQDNKEK